MGQVKFVYEDRLMRERIFTCFLTHQNEKGKYINNLIVKLTISSFITFYIGAKETSTEDSKTIKTRISQLATPLEQITEIFQLINNDRDDICLRNNFMLTFCKGDNCKYINNIPIKDPPAYGGLKKKKPATKKKPSTKKKPATKKKSSTKKKTSTKKKSSTKKKTSTKKKPVTKKKTSIKKKKKTSTKRK
jgi:hypothetical protein